jgi:hypothetical protein
MTRIVEMVARLVLGLMGLMLAMLFMRLVAREARRARVSNTSIDNVHRKDAALLKQDPVSGIYYPAD